MLKDHQRVHPKFKLNGASLKELAFTLKNKNSLIENKSLASFLFDWLNDNDQITLKTSGTTGNPKKIKVNKNAMILSAQSTGKYFNIVAGDKALLCLPIEFIAGKMMIVRAIVLGLDLHITSPSRSPINELTQDFDFVAMTPIQLRETINYIHKIKCLLIGGSPVGKNLREKILNKTSGVFETYGMTETLSHVAVKNLSAGEESFKAVFGITFKDNMGCLEIIAPFISKLPIKTNDKVELISNTRFKWIGRNSLIINSGGIKFNPEKIERKLDDLYDQSFIICGLPDEILGEKIVIVFEEKIPLNAELSFKKLNKYEKPKEIFLLQSFIRNNGKIERRDVRARLLSKKNGS